MNKAVLNIREKNYFNIEKNDVIAITGAGGKTSLMCFLADKLSKKGRVLMTTTTKIYRPEKDKYENLVIGKVSSRGNGKNIDLIVEKENVEEENNKKLVGLSYEGIEELKKDYDYILIEADGAKEKPLKGWKEDEPCIPDFVTKSIGVVNIKSLGRELDGKNIHRFEIFVEQLGISLEDEGKKIRKDKEDGKDKKNKISLDILKKYIEKGSFHRGSLGKKIIFLNAVEGEEDFEPACILGKGIENFYLGSVHNMWIEKLKNIDAVVMASGYSKRFGKEDKLLIEVDKRPCIENLFIELKKLPFNRVVVVGRRDEIKKLSEKYNYTYVENKEAHLGQSESVKLGVKNSLGDAVAFFPGDQPYLKKDQIMKIIEEYQRSDEIALPIVEGKPNTPVIFPLRYREELLKLEGDTGGREIIKKYPKVKVEFQEYSKFKDIDRVEDIED